MATSYLDLVEVVQVTMSTFEVQDSQVVALVQVVGLGMVIVEYQYFGQATVEVLSIGLQTANSPRMVAIGSTSSAFDYSVSQAKKVGSSKSTRAVANYFAKDYSNQVDYIVEDLRDYSFAIDYLINLNFAKGPEAYLDVGTMADIEEKIILSHHLHLS